MGIHSSFLLFFWKAKHARDCDAGHGEKGRMHPLSLGVCGERRFVCASGKGVQFSWPSSYPLELLHRVTQRGSTADIAMFLLYAGRREVCPEPCCRTTVLRRRVQCRRRGPEHRQILARIGAGG